MYFQPTTSVATDSGSFLLSFFFSLYSIENGYTETEVFLADLNKRRIWYEIRRPIEGRVEIACKSRVYVMCRTIKSSNWPQQNIQQSDYIQLWKTKAKPAEAVSKNRIVTAIKTRPELYAFMLALHRAIRKRLLQMDAPGPLSPKNTRLRKLNISGLVD